MNAEQMEKYSSAVTLSDMEIFVFPELMYSLALANIMSPVIWRWRDDPWFKDIDKMNDYRRVLRLKQYIIDHFEFNLDLDTWGLTNQAEEVKRFTPWMDVDTISKSNALYGYEGDKYYFSLDIRKHFGLDKYSGDIIPYWKTETVEAMTAFCHKEGYQSGAGECVSLAALYASALFIVCKIPLENIFLMATPLHSQNFILVKDGVLTNNRRIVTKNMWFNGTELTAKAQRALRNEQVTVVAHHSGYIHAVYPESTIDPAAYDRFKTVLHDFMAADLNMDIVVNFFRQHSQYQKCFQIEQDHHGHKRYLPLECAFHYEHCGPYKVNRDTRVKLLADIDEYVWQSEPIENRSVLEQLESFFDSHRNAFKDKNGCESLVAEFGCPYVHASEIVRHLQEFVALIPQLPDNKVRVPSESIVLDVEMTREEVIDVLEAVRTRNTTADLAFYALRDMTRSRWEPFMKAAMERNPVCCAATESMNISDINAQLGGMDEESIYEGSRLAQPDEVWNFGRGDGLEKAICFACILRKRQSDIAMTLEVDDASVTLTCGDAVYRFSSSKGLKYTFSF
ncbi:MAG: hypothetical protein EOL87_13525 [Spartobacteria bacterium]|nr:hypothetical protein [Spartobacteria bacterium]